MTTEIGSLAPHLALMLVGGLVASFGPGWWARKEKARGLLAGTSGWRLGVLSLVVVAVAGGGLYGLVRSAADTFTSSPESVSPLIFLLGGVLIGLPLSLPAVLAAWHDARSEKRKARTAPATKDDRRAFAERITEQIRDVTRPPRDVEGSITGDGGRVLLFEGDLEQKEGDRLVKALKHELQDLGFKRVEGKGPKGDWWTRV